MLEFEKNRKRVQRAYEQSKRKQESVTKSRDSVVPQRDFGQEINDMAGSMLVYENILVHLAHIVIAKDVVSEPGVQVVRGVENPGPTTSTGDS